jgi:hypothetical protein
LKTVIGLGSIGRNILKEFVGNKNYRLISIDEETTDENAFETYVIKPNISGNGIRHESFEQEYPSLEKDLNGVDQNVYFVLSGASDISGATLAILSYLKDKTVTIIYIRPELDFLSSIEKKQEKVTRNVLQEYARSGLISRIILLDNSRIEGIIGDVSVGEYYSSINKHIGYAIQALDTCEKSKSIFGNINEISELCRISTLALLTPEKKEYPFYLLKFMEKNIIFPLEKTYFFLVGEERLKNDKILLKETKTLLRDLKNVDQSIGFGIFGSNLDIDYKLVIMSTTLVQK